MLCFFIPPVLVRPSAAFFFFSSPNQFLGRGLESHHPSAPVEPMLLIRHPSAVGVAVVGLTNDNAPVQLRLSRKELPVEYCAQVILRVHMVLGIRHRSLVGMGERIMPSKSCSIGCRLLSYEVSSRQHPSRRMALEGSKKRGT